MRIKSILTLVAFATGVMIAAPSSVLAADVGWESLGQKNYMTYCATCHGEMGKGAGPLTPFLAVEVPDLTVLSQNNDGVFPLLRVIHIIDGRTGMGAHGGPMPVFGDMFSSHIGEEAGDFGAEALIRGRVLTLADYLESIQR